MKSNRLAILMVLLSILVIACLCSGVGNTLPSGTNQPNGNQPGSSGTNPQSGNQPGSSGIITTVVMAQSVQGASDNPVNPTTVFSANSTIHAVAEIKDAPANTKFTATWYIVDVGSAEPSGTLIDSSEVVSSGTRNLDFYLTPNSTWPAGKYRVEISVNGHVDQIVFYTVQ